MYNQLYIIRGYPWFGRHGSCTNNVYAVVGSIPVRRQFGSIVSLSQRIRIVGGYKFISPPLKLTNRNINYTEWDRQKTNNPITRFHKMYYYLL